MCPAPGFPAQAVCEPSGSDSHENGLFRADNMGPLEHPRSTAPTQYSIGYLL
jgi:hypothetical protein